MMRPKGFTLMEVIIAVGITLAITAFVLANYSRGGNDSILSRETSLLMARIRFAQEESSSGKTFNYCYHLTGTTCTNNSAPMVCSNDPYRVCATNGDCLSGGICRFACDPQGNGGYNCCPGGTGRTGVCPAGNDTPSGGFAISLTCPNMYNDPYADHDYPFMTNAATWYGLFAERRTCGNGSSPTLCFPPNYLAFNDATIGSDGIISAMTFSWSSGSQLGQKGDTAQERYVLHPAVLIKDVQLTASKDIPTILPSVDTKTFNCQRGSPWRGKTITTAGNSVVPGTYPLQAAIRFIPPDGRAVMISDNIAQYPPNSMTTAVPDSTNPWQKAEVMLALAKRTTSDCQVVTATRAGIVSQRNDADCNFATPN